jgi:GT2 family glycosyltransferase
VEEQLVSVVIPTFNCAHFLSRALQSVLDQTYKNWEALVIDNHSLDDTDAVVRGFGDQRISLLKVHNHGVIAVSRNLGIREAKGRWIAFLDADDWWTADKLEVSLDALGQGNDLVYHDLIHVAAKPRVMPRHSIKTWDLHTPKYLDLINHGNALTNSSVVVRRDLLVEIGGLVEDPDLVGAEDLDCWIRFSRRTERLLRLPAAHGYYWIGSGNTSSPARAIVCLSALRRRHLEPDGQLHADYSPAWLSFAIGKAHFQLHQYDLAIGELSRISFASSPIMVFLKAHLFGLMVRLVALRQSA